MPSIRNALALAAGLALIVLAPSAAAVRVVQTNLVTDDPLAHPAQITDPDMKNAWGVSASPTSPFWVSDNATGKATLYAVNPLTQVTTKQALVVTIPGDGSVTGQVFNGGSGFNGDRFLFVSEDGTVAGWRGALGTNAEVLVTGSTDNVYKGSALGALSGNSYLYAANFRTGNIDVFKGSSGAPDLTGRFTDPTLPAGYAPFNIQNLGGTLYVAYALQDATKKDEVAGAGLGFVDSFDLNGNFLGRLAGGGALDAPWGLAIAPASFGALAGAVLVGNFGDGRISAYDPVTDAFLGQLLDDGTGSALVIDGLWALTVGNGGSGGSADRLYFSAGPDNESHGLFGVLAAVAAPSAPVAEPGSAALALAALLLLGGLRVRRRGR